MKLRMSTQIFGDFNNLYIYRYSIFCKYVYIYINSRCLQHFVMKTWTYVDVRGSLHAKNRVSQATNTDPELICFRLLLLHLSFVHRMAIAPAQALCNQPYQLFASMAGQIFFTFGLYIWRKATLYVSQSFPCLPHQYALQRLKDLSLGWQGMTSHQWPPRVLATRICHQLPSESHRRRQASSVQVCPAVVQPQDWKALSTLVGRDAHDWKPSGHLTCIYWPILLAARVPMMAALRQTPFHQTPWTSSRRAQTHPPDPAQIHLRIQKNMIFTCV